MSPYRESSKPNETDRFIHLPVTRARRFVLGPCLWCLLIGFLFFVLQGLVEPWVTGEGWWKFGLALVAWPLFPLIVTRVVRFESVLIGAQTLRRVGFLGDKVVRWTEVQGVRRFERQVKRRSIPLIGVQSEAGELVIAELAVDDAKGVLDWALAAATTGRVEEIEERVRTEGQAPRRTRWYLPHIAVALVLSAVFAGVFYKDTKRRFVERTIRDARELPLVEQIVALTPLFDDTSLRVNARCQVGMALESAHARTGAAASAVALCERRVQLDCTYQPPDACAPFFALRDAGAALDAGEPARALRLLDGWRSRGAERGAIEVPALVALARMDEAREASARCLDVGSDAEPAIQGLAERCRLAP